MKNNSCQEMSGFNRYLKNAELRKKAVEVGAENLAQVYTKEKYTRESHLEYSHSVLNFLKAQNFMNEF